MKYKGYKIDDILRELIKLGVEDVTEKLYQIRTEIYNRKYTWQFQKQRCCWADKKILISTMPQIREYSPHIYDLNVDKYNSENNWLNLGSCTFKRSGWILVEEENESLKIILEK